MATPTCSWVQGYSHLVLGLAHVVHPHQWLVKITKISKRFFPDHDKHYYFFSRAYGTPPPGRFAGGIFGTRYMDERTQKVGWLFSKEDYYYRHRTVGWLDELNASSTLTAGFIYIVGVGRHQEQQQQKQPERMQTLYTAAAAAVAVHLTVSSFPY